MDLFAVFTLGDSAPLITVPFGRRTTADTHRIVCTAAAHGRGHRGGSGALQVGQSRVHYSRLGTAGVYLLAAASDNATPFLASTMLLHAKRLLGCFCKGEELTRQLLARRRTEFVLLLLQAADGEFRTTPPNSSFNMRGKTDGSDVAEPGRRSIASVQCARPGSANFSVFGFTCSRC